MKSTKVHSLVTLVFALLAIAAVAAGPAMAVNVEAAQEGPTLSSLFPSVLDLLENDVPMTPADQGVASFWGAGICLNSCMPCFSNADCNLIPFDRCLIGYTYCP